MTGGAARRPVSRDSRAPVLRWVDGRLSVEVRDSAPPGAPLPARGPSRSVQVWLDHRDEPRVAVEWNLGCHAEQVRLGGLFFNDPDPEVGGHRPPEWRQEWRRAVRGRGFGTLAVNTGVQYLRTLYPGPDGPYTTELCGDMVTPGPGLPPGASAADRAERQRDVDGRARFWLRFGFQVGDEVPGRPATRGPYASKAPLYAPLWRVTTQPGGVLVPGRAWRDGAAGRSLWVPLSAFTPARAAPAAD